MCLNWFSFLFLTCKLIAAVSSKNQGSRSSMQESYEEETLFSKDVLQMPMEQVLNVFFLLGLALDLGTRTGKWTEILGSRYGEKVEEVAKLEDWKCPKCRGICNCSVCMWVFWLIYPWSSGVLLFNIRVIQEEKGPSTLGCTYQGIKSDWKGW